MSKIYTKTGDKGQTSLMDGTRVAKNDIRVETYGTVDELNSILGVVGAVVKNKTIKEEIATIQNDLFDIGSRLSNPSAEIEKTFINYLEKRITHFEETIDTLTTKLPPLRNFILPSGSLGGAQLHIARSTARRTERRLVALSQHVEIEGVLIKYINRLSDLFFTLSRFVNKKAKQKEIIWTKRSR